MASGQATPPLAPVVPKDRDANKKHESLFGPNIGPVNTGPAWTTMNAKKVVHDELTADVVKSWIEKSKEPSHTTTTVQALVNLKRPTIRLSPLSQSKEDSHLDLSLQHQQHGLEFEYDCDAPKCGIYVHALVHPDHPESTKGFAPALTSILAYESLTSGGFGKALKIEDGATLELGRYEHVPARGAPSGTVAESSGEKSAVDADEKHDRRKRFTIPFKKRLNHSVAGPALAVVDAEPSHSEHKETDDDAGVRVTIRLVALDEQGTELASPNEQVTYLHVVRFGAPSATLEAGEEDPRPWVVKVVKREATIGPHTFHLHEIYGLSSSSTNNSAPTAPIPSTHTYPPAEASEAPVLPTPNDETSSECLVCLSSPREVVLLPCRHLVACKECALNMVEFGAGGNITHAEDPAEPAEPGAMAADENQAEAGTSAQVEPTPAAAAAPTPTPAPRRKRKAKGWFCPVCRQPYTSLLRITTSPPPEPSKLPLMDVPAVPSTPVPAQPAVSASAHRPSPLLSHFRPAFLRSVSRHPPNDPERQA